MTIAQQKDIQNKSQLYLIKLIIERITSIRNILVVQGYPKQAIEQYLTMSIKNTLHDYKKIDQKSQLLKILIQDSKYQTSKLQLILTTLDIELGKLKIKKEQKNCQFNGTKQKNNKLKQKSLRENLHNVPKSKFYRNQSALTQILRPNIKQPHNYQLISDTLIKAEILKEFIAQKMMLVQLCHKRLQTLNQFEELSYEGF